MSVAGAVARRRAVMVARIADAVRAELPDMAVEVAPAGVMVSGRGLGRRRLHDVRLRGIVGAVREAAR